MIVSALITCLINWSALLSISISKTGFNSNESLI